MAKGGLTPKQQKFVSEYLIDLNATQAAIRAGYKKRTARSVGQENLTKPDIQKAIEEAQKNRAKKNEIDADWVLKRLIESVEADLSDIMTADGGLYPVNQWPDAFRKGLIAGIEILEERDKKGNVTGILKKVKLSDRLRRLELIGKHIGMWPNKLEHSGKVDLEGASEFLLEK